MCESKWRGKTKFRQLFSHLNLAFESQLSSFILFCSAAMKGSASCMKGGSIKETKPENKQFFFTDMYIILTLSGITGISSRVLNYVFALLPIP